MHYGQRNRPLFILLCYTARPRIKKQALRLMHNLIKAHDNSIIAVTMILAGFVQQRFHCMPVGRNETLVIGRSFI